MSAFAIYARKSIESEDRQVLSIDSQVKELQAFAQREGLGSPRIFTESQSAKAPGRTVFGRLVQFVQRGEIDGVICWKLDRLARNPVDGGAIIWAMEEGKLRRICTPQRSFANTGNDKFWMQLEFGMAKKYVDDLSDNVKRGLRAKIEQGWRPGVPPIGYLNDRLNKRIIRDDKRFPLVRKMWDLMLSGNYSPATVLKIATEQWGLRTRTSKRMGGGPVAYASIYQHFHNPFYYGAIRSNGVLFPGAHPPMVTKSEFDRVQEILSRSSRLRPKLKRFAFTGLMTCGECGAAITAEHKVNQYGYHYTYYHCTKRKRTVRCSQKVIEQRELERQVSAFLATLTIPEEMHAWALRTLRETQLQESRAQQERLSALQKRHENCGVEGNELLNLRLRGLLSDEQFSAKRKELDEERFRLKELIDNFAAHERAINGQILDTIDFARTAQQRFAAGTEDEKRAILSFTGSNLVLKGKLLQIQPRKPLSVIQKAVAVNATKSTRFESTNLGLAEAKTAPREGGIRMWFATLEDVRTFFQKHPTATTFKDALVKAREVLSQPR